MSEKIHLKVITHEKIIFENDIQNPNSNELGFYI